MKKGFYNTGFKEMDKALGGGVRPGSVLILRSSLIRDPDLLSLCYMARGIERGEISLLVNFRSVSLTSLMKTISKFPQFGPLFESEEPMFIDITSSEEMRLIGDLIESTGVSRLILSHPEVLSYREGENVSFERLEALLRLCRDMGTGVIIDSLLELSNPYLLISDGVIDMVNTSDGHLQVTVDGYPHPGGHTKFSLEEGYLWGR